MITWEHSGSDSFYTYIKDQKLSANLIDSLYKKGKESPTGRARLCLHNDPSSSLHIMLIHHDQRTVVPIHKHSPFGEFVLVQDGEVELACYDSDLNMSSVTRLSSSAKGDIFYFTPPNVWHTLRFERETIFFEISQGPLNVKVTEFANCP